MPARAVRRLTGPARARARSWTPCRIAWDATGFTYAGACLSAVGAQGLTDASAIPARTVASWLKRIELGEGLTGIDVLVVDEAVMTDDRSAAQLLTEAARTGTQVLAIGDPLQLQAVGIGGWFREVHRLVGGLTLYENRRQRDASERAALDIWRTGDHRQALEMLAAAERVHPAATADEARSQMLMAWDKLRADWPDELDLLENLAVLAPTTTTWTSSTPAPRSCAARTAQPPARPRRRRPPADRSRTADPCHPH
ncbi:hypothetical protein A4V12_24665 [Streptomyces noursei]|nr:hypothetical protein A4V12_24665 [Streptomyces noursei]